MSAPERPAHFAVVRANPLPSRILLVLFVGLAAILAAPAFGVMGGNLATLVLCVAVAVVALIPILINQTRPIERRNILLTLFLLGFVARFVIPPLILYVPEPDPIDVAGMYLSALRPWDVAMGQFVVLIALLAFLAGHMVPLVRKLSPGSSRSRRDWRPDMTFAMGVGLILFGWVVMVALSFGLVPASLGSGIASTLGSSTYFGNVLLALAYLRHRQRAALIVILVTLPLTSLVGFLSGSKTATLLPAAFIALTYVVEKRRVPVTMVAVGLLALAILYPASEYVRMYLMSDRTQSVAELLMQSGTATSDIGRYVQRYTVGDYLTDGFSAVAARLDSTGVVSVIVRDTPRLSPYQNGSTLILFFVSFIPRALWADKPSIAIGQFITDVYGSGSEIESSTGPSQIGDYYLNFSYGGVVVGMFLLGIALRLAYDLLLEGRRQPSAPALMAAISIVFSVILTFETNVAMAQARVFFLIAPIMILDYFVRTVGGSRNVDSPVAI